jgi:hypothetical protein
MYKQRNLERIQIKSMIKTMFVEMQRKAIAISEERNQNLRWINFNNFKMDFCCGGGTGADFLPNLASTMCFNRKFGDDNELELETEQRMLQVQLCNALWHRTSPPQNLLYPSAYQLPPQQYKPLGFRSLENDDDEEEEEEEEDEVDDDPEPEEDE